MVRDVNHRDAPAADPDLDDPEAPTFMDEPVLAADWAYRGYACRVYREHTEHDYPLCDRERIVGMVDGDIVWMYSDDPLKYNIEAMIDACEQWVDSRMSGWLQ